MSALTTIQIIIQVYDIKKGIKIEKQNTDLKALKVQIKSKFSAIPEDKDFNLFHNLYGELCTVDNDDIADFDNGQKVIVQFAPEPKHIQKRTSVEETETEPPQINQSVMPKSFSNNNSSNTSKEMNGNESNQISKSIFTAPNEMEKTVADFDNSYHISVDCHICEQNFIDLGKYASHLKKHYTDDPNKEWLQCEICNANKKKNAANFISHITNHLGRSKPFKCDIPNCGRSLSIKNSMKGHLDRHWLNYIKEQTAAKSANNSFAKIPKKQISRPTHQRSRLRERAHLASHSRSRSRSRDRHNIRNKYGISGRITGKCTRWFTQSMKGPGFGFIACDDGRADAFFNARDVITPNVHNLGGEMLEFTVRIQTGGRHHGKNRAFNVRLVRFGGSDRERSVHRNRNRDRRDRDRNGDRYMHKHRDRNVYRDRERNEDNVWHGTLQKNIRAINVSLSQIGGEKINLKQKIPKTLKIGHMEAFANYNIDYMNGLLNRDILERMGRLTVVVGCKYENDQGKEEYAKIIQNCKEMQKCYVIDMVKEAKIKIVLFPSRKDGSVFDVDAVEKLWGCSLLNDDLCAFVIFY